MGTEIQFNPALQLLRTLDEFRLEAPNSNRAIDAWIKILKGDQSTIISQICELNKLIDQVVKLISNDPNVINKSRHLEWVSNCRSALMFDALFVGAASIANGALNPSHRAMSSLDFCVEALSKSAHENEIDSSVLSQLSIDAHQLLVEILNEIEDPKLKVFLSELMQCFIFGIHNYQIRGSEGLDESISLVLGKVLRDKPLLANSGAQKKNTFQKFWSYITTLTKTVNEAKNVISTAQLTYESFEKFQDAITASSL